MTEIAVTARKGVKQIYFGTLKEGAFVPSLPFFPVLYFPQRIMRLSRSAPTETKPM